MVDLVRKRAINKAFYKRNRERILSELKSRYRSDPSFSKKIKKNNKKYREANKDTVLVSKVKEKKKHATRYSLYWRWKNMMTRCFNQSHRDYKNYGARGIIVEPPLLVFKEYAAYVEALPRPKGFSFTAKFHLDRINNEVGYKIGNLRWVTVRENLENSRNKKNNPSLKKGAKMSDPKKPCSC